jgi:hypothetical protein
VTPGEGRVELFGGPFDSRSRYKWLRAVVVPGGDIYGIPAGADDVVKIRLPNEVPYRLSRRTWRTVAWARVGARSWCMCSTTTTSRLTTTRVIGPLPSAGLSTRVSRPLSVSAFAGELTAVATTPFFPGEHHWACGGGRVVVARCGPGC